MSPEVQSDPMEQAHEALRTESWDRAAELARLALRQAELLGQESEAALAHFILGTALAGPVGAPPHFRDEAECHLLAALPQFDENEELALAGETRALLGGLAVVRARAGGLAEQLVQASEYYRGAVEDFMHGEELMPQCTAIHNLGLCLSARASDTDLPQTDRLDLLDEALECFHDALELEVECGLHEMAEHTDRERVLAQLMHDALKGQAGRTG